MSKTTKHTPAPWEACDPPLWGADPVEVYSDTGESADPVALVYEGPQRDANINLITAAPDLFAACKAVLDPCNYQGTGEPWPELFMLVRDAIAKAEAGQ